MARQESYRPPRSRRRTVAPQAADEQPNPGRQREVQATVARVADGCDRLLRLLADVPAKPSAAGHAGSPRHLARLLELLDTAAAAGPGAGGSKDGWR